ncbi:hypothetical protein BGX26_010720 [Mortierella sp. AD094]|nr:hypothetical protein BGX26_010720 [Mortierella sp. AD094]
MAHYPPPASVPSDLTGGTARAPLPPVSENAALQTGPKVSETYSRPSPVHAQSVPSVPQFTVTGTPSAASIMPNSITPPLSTSPGGTTKIDMERIMKQDEAAMNDFVPPRQAMNSDESDFDWDEDIKIDDSGQVHTKNKSKQNDSKWRKLSPFLRMVITILVGCPIIALPAILVSTLMQADQVPDPTNPDMLDPPATKATVTLIFVWLSFMWGIIFVTNWGVDIVPVFVVRLSSIISSNRLENVKSRLMIFVATKKYLKWLLASCWSIGSFAFLSKSPFSRTDGKLNPIFLEVLGVIVVGCTLILIEKILLHIISTNFHRTAYADRIKESKYALSVLDRLSTSKKNVKKGRPTHSRHSTVDNNHGDYNFPASYRSALPSRPSSLEATNTINNNNNNNNNNFINHSSTFNGTTGNFNNYNHNGNHTIDSSDLEAEIMTEIKSESPERMTEAMILNSTPMTTPTEFNTSRNSTLVSTTGRPLNNNINNNNHPHPHHHHHRGIRLKPNENIFRGINRRLHGIALANKSSPTKDIGSTANAKRLAKTLFYNLQSSGDELVVQDFYPYFDTVEEAKEAFAIFDKDGNGDISKSEMKEKIFYVYKERKDLHTSLRDLSQAVGKLDVIFLTIMSIVWLLVVLSIFGKDVVKNMLSIGSFLVALSFVFGNSLKILFENIVFLFITHPYDSGDLVSIDGNDMYVREVGLNSTTFVTWDGKRMYYPNYIISQKPIHNVRRSPNMTDKIVLNIDCYTPQSKILELRARMRDYLIKESKEFLPDLEIQIQEMDVKLKISMCIEHKGNWQDSGRRWARRTAFNYALKEAIEDIGIQYYALPQRVEVYNRELGQEVLKTKQDPDEQENIDDQQTLGPNSPLRQYPPEHVARLYRRHTIKKPEGGDGGE